MRGAIIIVVLLVILIGGITAAYFLLEKPKEQEAVQKTTFQNVSINAFLDKKRVETGFQVFQDGVIVSSGKTLSDGAIFDRVLINSSFQIVNSNVDNQNYYSDECSGFADGTEISKRCDLNLVQPGNISIDQQGIFGTNNNITLFISANGRVNNLIVCLSWTAKIINANIENLSEIEIPNEIKQNYDRCYNLNNSLNNNALVLNLNYNLFGSKESFDKIDVAFVDRDKINGTMLAFSDGKDIGMKNIIYSLK